MALSSYALITLADCKAWLDIDDTSQDDLITGLINSQTRMIEQYTARKWAARDYVMMLNVSDSTLLLPNFPIIKMRALKVGRQSAISVTYTGSQSNPRIRTSDLSAVNTDAPDAGCNKVILYDDNADETEISASGNSLNTIKTSINLVSGWSASVVYTSGAAGSHYADDIIRMSESAQSRTVYLEIPATTWNDFHFDPETGVVEFAGNPAAGTRFADTANVKAEWRGGFENVQTDNYFADMRQICAELVQAGLYEFGQAYGVKSESLGDFSQSFDGLSRDEAMKQRLGPYCDWARLAA